ncbi:MAG: type II secretion system protein GspD [Desulfococcus sp. 4484_242]|nr:MAG: type II secretion system protein GspD [Desulfococcus sp. 4484_242]
MKTKIWSKVLFVILLSFWFGTHTGCGGGAGTRPKAATIAMAGAKNKKKTQAVETGLKHIDREAPDDAGAREEVVAGPLGKAVQTAQNVVFDGRADPAPAAGDPDAGISSGRKEPLPAPSFKSSAPRRPEIVPEPPDKDKTRDADQKIILNFDDADLYEVIKTIAELLRINYIVDPGIKGRVTIQTAGGLARKDLFPVFFQILEANNLTAFREGNLYKIVPMKDASRMPIHSRTPADSPDLPMSERVMIQIIPLKFISSREVTKLITPFVSEGGAIVSDQGSNTLVVVDKGANILKILRLVAAFDVDVFDRVHYRFYRLRYLDAEEASKLLTDFAAVSGDPAAVVKFAAISRLNSLLAMSTNPGVFEKIDDIVREIDVASDETAPRIHVYFVKNGEAEDLADLLEEVFLDKRRSATAKDKKTTKAGGTAAVSRNPFSQSAIAEKKAEEKAREKKAATPVKRIEGTGEGTGTVISEIKVTPDPIRNALIIEATPPDYRVVEGILKQLDVLPRQVLIEATIAEISVNTKTELGMEWALGRGAAQGNASFSSTINKLVGSGSDAAYSGLKYSIGVTDKWYAALHALASEGKVNVLSSPHVLASDNKEARIDVSREIPIASGTTTIASSTVVGETTIEYRDTGVILSVTPHINDRGLVTMDISEEVSDLEKQAITVAGEDYPAFFKRAVNTTLTVKDGQTIAIGGLIKDKEDESATGVPCLIKIPVARYLFGEWGKDVEKIELIVLITPRVVANLDDVDAVTNEFKQKVRNVMKRFYQ